MSLCRVFLWVAVLNVASVCAAQTQDVPPDPPAIDPTKLGVSFDRVRIQLALTPPTKTSGLRIQETIVVVGQAPKIQLWNPERAKLRSQAVPFGGPTQKDILKLTTPKEFQNYPFDLNALMQWLMENLNKRAE